MKIASSPWIPFVDCLSSILVVMVAMVYLQLLQPHLKANETAAKAGITPGRLCVELYWPDNIPVDLDLWGQEPDGDVVGYSNKSGHIMDLLRDDRGSDVDPEGKNYEIMCARNIVKGHWTFNAHYYSQRNTHAKDVPVTMVINMMTDDINVVPIKTTGILHSVGSEITMFDFDIDDKGHIVKSTMNNDYHVLRNVGGKP